MNSYSNNDSSKGQAPAPQYQDTTTTSPFAAPQMSLLDALTVTPPLSPTAPPQGMPAFLQEHQGASLADILDFAMNEVLADDENDDADSVGNSSFASSLSFTNPSARNNGFGPNMQ
mmetsp:Transcript_10229/g.21096  ORF Transcript_10229/g.21096 Transcript_10229/m.21096 type:complete len:116 (-) Transcript_10229:154-501(-)|eukprot:CAMPEP_0172439402 /NCGR_PEP_ID=MMETSP1065-20121228/405_1 /TAXON_ID=265537 /ORGANISM="Amphiprora paludosa, Strain CCMP125" /LENGTH=115 /DNA_ID=CAMNT_0013188083 /DNA_START=97 /DNA_END=444 /DNA_ORIENTATION=-